MADLDEFLAHDVEGYLFHDLTTMQGVTVAPDAPGGGLGYPLLFTTFAGIELLGGLLSSSAFDKRAGSEYFSGYWCEYLYPTPGAASPPAEVEVLYQLARHGIAHSFLLKGRLGVVKRQPQFHLRVEPAGLFIVDACQLADDLMKSYWERIKPVLVAGPPNEMRERMSSRLGEIRRAYEEQAAAVFTQFGGGLVPSPPGPPPSGPSGPFGGPVPSHVSSSSGALSGPSWPTGA